MGGGMEIKSKTELRYLGYSAVFRDFRLPQDESEQHEQPSPQEIPASLLVAAFN